MSFTRHPALSAIIGVACLGCRVGSGADQGTDPIALPPAQQQAFQTARNSALVHKDIADVIQFIGLGLAPNLGGSGPFGGTTPS